MGEGQALPDLAVLGPARVPSPDASDHLEEARSVSIPIPSGSYLCRGDDENRRQKLARRLRVKDPKEK